jgi:hypothetical protein
MGGRFRCGEVIGGQCFGEHGQGLSNKSEDFSGIHKFMTQMGVADLLLCSYGRLTFRLSARHV